MSLTNYFNTLDYYRDRGRGIAVYNCDESTYELVCAKINETKYNSFNFKLSSFLNAEKIPGVDIRKNDFGIIYFDSNIFDTPEVIDYLINKISFPFYYRGKPIIFLSSVDRSIYQIDIDTTLIHTNLSKIVNQLLIEQLDSIINQTCLIFSSPDFLNQPQSSYLFTPIEKIMHDALLESKIQFTPQVRIGRFIVDFLIELNKYNLIVECDGRDYHNPFHDAERDKELLKHGYRVIHFTGSEIFNDIDNCLEKLRDITSYSIPHKHQIDSDLDDSQKKALNHISGPIRVLAPAGSGKTKTLINRIANLIDSGIDPNKILALAFNKKAAEEMVDRLEQKRVITAHRLLDDGVVVKTFHAFGYEIINSELGWKFDHDSEVEISRKLLSKAVSKSYEIPRRRNKDPLDAFLEALRKTKMELPSIDEVIVEDNNNLVPFGDIFDEYLRLQTKANFYNYDDMIYLALRILLKNRRMRGFYQNKIEYLLIDEFQDLNKAQIMMMQLLALPQNNLFIVGDDDQMIYGWRGAEISHILRFNERYVESEDCTLSTNYRSNKRIVYHSKWLIDHNVERVEKNIHPLPDKPPGIFDIKLSETMWDQAEAIPHWINNLRSSRKLKWKDFAILYRYNSYKYLLAMILDREKIPHTSVNGKQLIQHKVGRDIYSYLKVILYPQKSGVEDFSIILKRPNRSLPNEVIDKINSWGDFESKTTQPLPDWQKAKINDVYNKIRLLREKAKELFHDPNKFILMLANEIGLKEFYIDQSKVSIDLDESSDEIIYEVILAITTNFTSLDDLYGYMTRCIIDNEDILDETDEEKQDEVMLSSIHKSKGKEFTNVIYFNLVDSGKTHGQLKIEEERRVTYVGVTRAIENILITSLKEKYSMFLKEMALNPEYKGKSEIQLNNILARNHRVSNIIQNKLIALDSKIQTIIMKYPELQGDFTRDDSKFFQGIKSWFRQKNIDKANNNIWKLEAKKASETNKQLPVKDIIEQIELELTNRRIFQGHAEVAP
jgi:superfamily I DNA/RNA helicase/very-short-patch-repair endonuclease